MLSEFCCSCGSVVIVLFVAAALLRLAITFANLFIRPEKPQSSATDDWGDLRQWNWDDWDDEPEQLPPPPRVKAIPQPSWAKALLIVFLMLIAETISYLSLGLFVEAFLELRLHRFETRMLVFVLNIPFGFLLMCFVLSLMLPTTFWRSAWVAFLFHAILLGFSLIVGVMIVGLIAILA
jgi:hypothetical protein